MSTTLKTWHPDVAFGGAHVGADEVDFFHTYTVFYPSVNATAVATCKSIASASALVENVQGVCDYPRNLVVKCAGGTSSGTYGGTVVINGLNQFGDVIQETFSIATAVNGGIAVGTKVFAKFTSGTATLAGDTAVATCNVGFGTAGTTTLFGLPFKVGGTADLVNMAWASVSAAALIHSNALGSYVSTTEHAILARTDFGTASGFTAWLKSTKNQSEDTTSVVGR
jgi:hypothetical protein